MVVTVVEWQVGERQAAAEQVAEEMVGVASG